MSPFAYFGGKMETKDMKQIIIVVVVILGISLAMNVFQYHLYDELFELCIKK